MQVTFVTEFIIYTVSLAMIVDLPTTGFDYQGMGTQAKKSNVPKHISIRKEKKLFVSLL